MRSNLPDRISGDLEILDQHGLIERKCRRIVVETRGSRRVRREILLHNRGGRFHEAESVLTDLLLQLNPEEVLQRVLIFAPGQSPWW